MVDAFEVMGVIEEVLDHISKVIIDMVPRMLIEWDRESIWVRDFEASNAKSGGPHFPFDGLLQMLLLISSLITRWNMLKDKGLGRLGWLWPWGARMFWKCETNNLPI